MPHGSEALHTGMTSTGCMVWRADSVCSTNTHLVHGAWTQLFGVQVAWKYESRLIKGNGMPRAHLQEQWKKWHPLPSTLLWLLQTDLTVLCVMCMCACVCLYSPGPAWKPTLVDAALLSPNNLSNTYPVHLHNTSLHIHMYGCNRYAVHACMLHFRLHIFPHIH